MNVYFFELRDQARAIAMQSTVLAAFLVLLIVLVYPIYFGAQAEVRAALDGFPPEFAAAFGLAVEDIFSYGGFYSFGFLYLSLIGAIMTATMGFTVFGREKQANCADFLLSKPLGRTKTFVAKLLASITGVLIANIVFTLTAVAVHAASGDESLTHEQVVLSALALLGVELVFLALSACVATFVRRIRSTSGMGTALGFVAGFVLSLLPDLTGEEVFRFVSPLQYFSPESVFSTGSFESQYVVMACFVTTTALAAAYVRYRFSDVPSR